MTSKQVDTSVELESIEQEDYTHKKGKVEVTDDLNINAAQEGGEHDKPKKWKSDYLVST